MNIPENIAIFVAAILIISILANAAFIGLAVAHINTEQAKAYKNASKEFQDQKKRVTVTLGRKETK